MGLEAERAPRVPHTLEPHYMSECVRQSASRYVMLRERDIPNHHPNTIDQRLYLFDSTPHRANHFTPSSQWLIFGITSALDRT